MRLLKDELIGKKAKVVESSNKSLVGVEGKIVDETKNSLVIDTGDKEKRLLKNSVTLLISGYKIEGSLLAHRPEERIKIKPRIKR